MSLNKIMLIGNVGQDPQVRYIDAGVCTAQISLATSTPAYTLQNGTQVPERTEWHTLYLWRRLAEVAERYVHKGDKLYVEGEMRYRNYTDKKGVSHRVAEVWVSNMELLTPKSASSETSAPNASSQSGNATSSDASAKPENKLPF